MLPKPKKNFEPCILHFVLLLIKNNTTSSSGFLSHWFNNMQQAALLTLSVQYDKVLSKFGQQQLVMVNYACGFNQSETGKYIKWIIIKNYLLKAEWILVVEVNIQQCLLSPRGDSYMKKPGWLSSQVQIKGVDDEMSPFLTVKVSFRVHSEQW